MMIMNIMCRLLRLPI